MDPAGGIPPAYRHATVARLCALSSSAATKRMSSAPPAFAFVSYLFPRLLSVRAASTSCLPSGAEQARVTGRLVWDQVGEKPQNVNVFVSTAAFDTWVVDSAIGCPDAVPIADCKDARGGTFNYNNSLTWTPNSIFTLALEDNLNLDSTGDFGFDTVTLGYQGSGEPSLEHQVVATIGSANYWLGIFGLNPQPSNFTTFNSPQTSYMSTLKDNNTIPSLSWAYSAGAYYRFEGEFASLVLGGYDSSIFTPTPLTIPFHDDSSRDLVVGIQSIKGGLSSTNLLPGGGIYSFLDSTVTWLYLPEDACNAFADTFGLTYNSTAELYFVNESSHNNLVQTNPSITFTLATDITGGQTVDIEFPYAAFDQNVTWPYVNAGESQRYFPIKQAQNQTQYTLGRTFFQEAVVIADYERSSFTVAPRTWDQNAQQNLVTIHSTSYEPPSSSSLSSGAIAGIVVGIVALVALAGLGVFFLRCSRKRKTAGTGSATGKHKKGSNASGEHPEMAHKPPFTSHETDSREKFELPPAQRQVYEMNGRQDSYTLKPEMYGSESPARSELPSPGETAGWSQYKSEPSELESPTRFELPGDSVMKDREKKRGSAPHPLRQASND
ncbi:MAG: hypothetical protein M1828_006136 [Chrysothrix sp. TS-e1954]|nr:MAG: hypothetical protein M1828_006136 [Chrysothrix sp. TS-e1954]